MCNLITVLCNESYGPEELLMLRWYWPTCSEEVHLAEACIRRMMRPPKKCALVWKKLLPGGIKPSF